MRIRIDFCIETFLCDFYEKTHRILHRKTMARVNARFNARER